MYFAPNIAIDEQIGFAILKKHFSNTETEEKEKVKITYKANGGTGEDIVVEVNKSEETSIAANSFAAPSDKEFKEWNTDASGSGTGYQADAKVTLETDMILYAIWQDSSTEEPEPEVEKYTVTYNANGGSGSVPEQQTVEKGSTITIAHNTLIAPEDKRFKEWNTVSTGLGTSYQAGQSDVVVNTKLDLYAIWVDDLVTITFNANGGSGSVDPVQVLRNHEQTLPKEDAFTAPEGKEFLKWNTTSAGNGTSYSANGKITPDNNVTLYAIWIDKE